MKIGRKNGQTFPFQKNVALFLLGPKGPAKLSKSRKIEGNPQNRETPKIGGNPQKERKSEDLRKIPKIEEK